jgi:hypothetical protein
MTKPNVTAPIQTPGEPAGVQPFELAPLLDLAPVDLAAGLSALSDLEIDALVELEQARIGEGPARVPYRDLLATEQLRRIEDNGAEPRVPELAADAAQANIGNAIDYARTLARDLDPAKIGPSPVLTLDGWLLPTPRATGE